MTYQQRERSAQGGRPVFKYQIIQGVDEYLYTSAPYIIGDSLGAFEPVAIEMTAEVKQTGELAKNGVTLTFPRDNPLAQTFVGYSPEVPTTVTIFRAHSAGSAEVSDDRLYWKGRVISSSVDDDTVSLECEDAFTSMNRLGLRAVYQKGCRHALYSEGCGLDRYDWATAASVVLVDGRDIVIEEDSVGADDYFAGGMAELADGTLRYITGQTGNTLTLLSPFRGLASDSAGVPITLYPGCAHNVDDCKDKFNNLVNYGGCPWLPGKNPFQNSVTGSIA